MVSTTLTCLSAVSDTSAANRDGHHKATNGSVLLGKESGKKMTARKYEKTREVLDWERKHTASNYHPMGIVVDRALGATIWDVDENEYIDLSSAYSAVNQGHCHPRILRTMSEQMAKVTLPSRAFHSVELGRFTSKVSELLGFERVLTMNTGSEATDTAVKLARKWAYMKKGIADGSSLVISVEGAFHGRSIAAISLSSDSSCREGFGPLVPLTGSTVKTPDGEHFPIRFNHAEDLEQALEWYGDRTAAFMLEPIQGEAGIIIPQDGYLQRVERACRKHNVLLICDEVQAGLGRSGTMLAHHHWGIKPDIVTVAKALSGGTYPISAVLSSREIMDCIGAGQHGSTFSGNPLACAVACTALDVLVEEDLCNRSLGLGQHFRSELRSIMSVGANKETGEGGWITAVRGLGLMNAIDINPHKSRRGRGAWDLCLLLASRGVLAKPTHKHTIRLAPPLVISAEELSRAVQIMAGCLHDLDQVDEIMDLSNHEGSVGFVSL